jgi:hypothetical protein
MYLSAERLALANQTVRETFERTSVAWQAIPHWDTGDPGQTRVRSDSLSAPAPLRIIQVPVPFEVTLSEAMAPTPDALLGKVMAATVFFAYIVDYLVIETIRKKITLTKSYDVTTSDKILAMLINARAEVEKFGYRAPSCIFVGTAELIDLSKLVSGSPGTDVLLGPANINTLHRVDFLEEQPPKASPNQTRLIFLGRRERIAQGTAPDASPGEEPVDLAVSVMPSLEVVGDTATNNIMLTIRGSGTVRIKDPNGLVALIGP